MGNQRRKPPFCFIQSDVLGGFGPWCKIASMLNKYGYSERWQKEADKVWQDVMTYGWKEELQSFSQTYDNMAMDSSLLLMEPYGFIAADDIRYHKTVKAVKKLFA